MLSLSLSLSLCMMMMIMIIIIMDTRQVEKVWNVKTTDNGLE